MGQGTGPEAEDLLPVRAEGGTGLGTGPWQLCGGGAAGASVFWARGSPWCLWVGGQEENTTGCLSWAPSWCGLRYQGSWQRRCLPQKLKSAVQSDF